MKKTINKEKQIFKKEECVSNILLSENDKKWTKVVDFREIKKGGVSIDSVMSCL